MNNNRRKAIAAEMADLETVVQMATDLVANLENIRDEEQEYVDNMPESLQNSEKADMANEAVEALSEVIDALQEIVDGGFTDRLDQASQ